MSSRQLLQPVDGNVSLTSAVLESAAKFAGVDVDEGVLPTAADLNALPIHGLVKKLASTSISTPQRPQQFSVPPEDSGRTDSVGAMSSSTTLEQLIEASSPPIKAAKTPALTPWGYQLPHPLQREEHRRIVQQQLADRESRSAVTAASPDGGDDLVLTARPSRRRDRPRRRHGRTRSEGGGRRRG